MRSFCIAVPHLKGEEVRRALLKEGILRRDLAIARDEVFIYIPILEGKGKGFMDYEVLERDFRVLQGESRSYKDLVDVPEDLRALLPTSFDVIGSVAIIKISDELMGIKEEIGEAILKVNKSLETVAIDTGIEGEERVRQLVIVAGKENTETIHKEYGIELEIDPAKVYFSPRLATEHWRVAQMVEEKEVIIDMFCGVGPFSILIAKHRNPGKIFSLDINEMAIHYLKRNINRNKVLNVKPMHGDSKVLVPNLENADRIIMNLPFGSYEFLTYALSNVKNEGMIHYYEVLEIEKKDEKIENILISAQVKGIDINIHDEREVHTYSPSSKLYCFDLKVDRDEGSLRSD
ncbi:MAG: class I SAM-dependent methyltransferase family protein [Thermoplasmata archaeon]|nr:MAG: class I SAM-dependent methyltransferase family protein [Thermoplasmata archaeon]